MFISCQSSAKNQVPFLVWGQKGSLVSDLSLSQLEKKLTRKKMTDGERFKQPQAYLLPCLCSNWHHLLAPFT